MDKKVPLIHEKNSSQIHVYSLPLFYIVSNYPYIRTIFPSQSYYYRKKIQWFFSKKIGNCLIFYTFTLNDYSLVNLGNKM